MFSQPCLEIFEGTVSDLIIKDNKVWALRMEGSEDVFGARVFVLTAGTFLGGKYTWVINHIAQEELAIRHQLVLMRFLERKVFLLID